MWGGSVGWQFWIDRGGTFTDVVAQSPGGELVTHKLLSENPSKYSDAAIQGIRDILDLSPDQEISARDIDAVKMGTTVATNALLEHKGERTLLLITQGFADLLEIGDQSRSDIFALEIIKPRLLYELVIEIEERIDATGQVLIPLNLEAARSSMQEAVAKGFKAVAIVCLHAYAFPNHELRLKDLALEMGFSQVSTSHETSALIKVVGRGETTVADAYLSPILRRYVNQVQAALNGVPLWFMQSHGGLVSADMFQGKDSILSGPAGGIVGAIKVCELAGFQQVITFDMGGTSTDVAHYDCEFERSTDRVIAGTRIRVPMLDIHTVAAGGGSVIRFAGQRMLVGPESAGAQPGPACYGNRGPLTVTDANLRLGRLVPESFPKTFGEHGQSSLDKKAVWQGFEALAIECKRELGMERTPEELALGALEISIQNMARAIKKISIQRGHDPAKYALCVFGGAAGQLACPVAEALGMDRIFVHPFSSVLSAYGMGLAEVRVVERQTIEVTMDEEGLERAAEQLDQLLVSATQKIQLQGLSVCATFTHLALRYLGSDQSLDVPLADLKEMQADFERKHYGRFGFISKDTTIVIASASVETIGPSQPPLLQSKKLDQSRLENLPAFAELWVKGAFRKVPIHAWDALSLGTEVVGPALVVSTDATIVIDEGWKATHQGYLLLERLPTTAARTGDAKSLDPVQLEIFNSAFMSIAEQMGYALQNTAASVNMKERLDFSCALFDVQGNLIANAPHMPVHLGSMGETVRALLDLHGDRLKPGQAFASNNPYQGGTHLPDITVIAPVFASDGKQRIAFLAARGHHADVGGLTPGSMPPFSTSLEEEGALFDMIPLLDHGAFREAAVLDVLKKGPYPARNPQKNCADLKAQLAALRRGQQEFESLIQQQSLPVVLCYLSHVQDYAEMAVKQVLRRLKSGRFQYPLDNGSVVSVSVKIDHDSQSAAIDFSGTSLQRSDNFNAPSAICKAAVLYVFRTLVQEDIPLNAGCLRPLRLVIPEGSMLAPQWPAAVVAGNVETSQVITDALYGALGVMAGAQGTMNNFTFGNETHQYYETIAGGSGAGENFPGADGVQTHMTNSRITDPEVLELRFPVILEQFSFRPNSGGCGRMHGGKGLVRRFRFLEEMTAAILANRRKIPPFGLAGGESASSGEDRVLPGDGEPFLLSGIGQVRLQPGDRIEILTPGGGGFGVEGE